jgi:uroporphyrin-III C-methyltransferase
MLRPGVRSALRRDDGTASLDVLTAAALEGPPSRGAVHLVGAGPGDAGLLTVRARELLLDADVVFHDALVSADVLRLCGTRTRIVDVGKRAGGARLSQLEINALLVDAARGGLEVVRLKGGDPFVFGRGGEELDALRAAGIDADVVPGVTSAFAAPAAADIPVTFRHLAGSVAVVTAQDSDGELPANLERIARAVDTVVVLMPLGVLPQIAARLTPVLGGEWPAALVAGATTTDQRVLRTSLGSLAAAAAADAGLVAPATLVLGRVVDSVRPAGSASAPASAVAGSRP